ncbi:hypothetical protein KKE06_02225 [Candidatus Micrarchaeota archaeon]|nr:hypothetical protein [Candidatus Micrarchaeota archaeon]MBU1930822.1 hypothetical protein [Candidatus Micrarchaeota archaeon]
MSFKSQIQGLFRRILGVSEGTPPEKLIEPQKPVFKDEFSKDEPSEIEEIHSIWDFLVLRENTQAFHLTQVIGFDEWVEMEEIRRRILELFGIHYKNERSLYPHLKTLSDLGLFETTDTGGKRKWRKKVLLVRLRKKKTKKEQVEEAIEESRTPEGQGTS